MKKKKEKTVYRLPHWWHFICFLIGYYSCYYSRIRPPLVFCFFSLYCYNLDVHWLCDPRLVSIPEARGLFRPDVDVHQKPLNSITSFSHQTEQRICCSKKLQSLMPLQTNIKEALHIFFFSVLSERKWACMFLSTIFLFHIAIWGKNEKIKSSRCHKSHNLSQIVYEVRRVLRLPPKFWVTALMLPWVRGVKERAAWYQKEKRKEKKNRMWSIALLYNNENA